MGFEVKKPLFISAILWKQLFIYYQKTTVTVKVNMTGRVEKTSYSLQRDLHLVSGKPGKMRT